MNSWEEEFYPLTAEESCYTDLQAVDHSILKWRGLTKENLEKYGLVKEKDSLFITKPLFEMQIDGDNCALCHRHSNNDSCGDCPLFEVRDGVMCTDTLDSELTSPFNKWKVTGDPQPMIKWLEKTRKLVLEKQDA